MEFNSARHHHQLPGCVTFWNNHLENWYFLKYVKIKINLYIYFKKSELNHIIRHLCIPHNDESPKTDEELE